MRYSGFRGRRSIAAGERFLQRTGDKIIGLQVALCWMRIEVLENNISHLRFGYAIIPAKRDHARRGGGCPVQRSPVSSNLRRSILHTVHWWFGSSQR
jgi:hypothetical protein